MELRGLVLAGEGGNDILELHLEHNVHTSLEVETEIDLLGLDVLVGVTEVNLLVRDGIDVSAVKLLGKRIKDVCPVPLGNRCEFL